MYNGFGDEIMLLEGIGDVTPDQAFLLSDKFPQNIRGATESVAKRVAANIVRASKYRSEILQLNKSGKLTPGLVRSYKNWLDKASILQQLLVKQLSKPGNRNAFVKKMQQAGLDPDQVIEALSKTPLAVADLTKSSSMSGFEFWPQLLFTGIVGLTVWKAPDAITAWTNLQKEGTARKIVEAQIECLKLNTDPAKCDAIAETDKRLREDARSTSSLIWFVGGVAIAGLGLFWLSRKKYI